MLGENWLLFCSFLESSLYKHTLLVEQDIREPPLACFMHFAAESRHLFVTLFCHRLTDCCLHLYSQTKIFRISS